MPITINLTTTKWFEDVDKMDVFNFLGTSKSAFLTVTKSMYIICIANWRGGGAIVSAVSNGYRTMMLCCEKPLAERRAYIQKLTTPGCMRYPTDTII